MQTFLPYSDFRDSVACLDYKRLGKQKLDLVNNGNFKPKTNDFR